MKLKATWHLLPALAAVVVVVVTGVVHGLWTNRWSEPEVGIPVERVAAVPMTLGDWDGTVIDMEASPYPRELIAASMVRRYVSRGNGSAVTIFLSWGRTGPLSLHTPKECYGGLGYQYTPPTKHRVREEPGAQRADFWVSRFSKPDAPAPEHLRIFWAWNATGTWQAPDSPRMAFVGHRTLYKLYVIRQLARADEPLENDPSLEFIPLLVQALEKPLSADLGGAER